MEAGDYCRALAVLPTG